MMEELFIDCSTGVAGDMLLASFIDLGVPLDEINKPLANMGLHEKYHLDVKETKSFSMRGLRVDVNVLSKEPSHRRWLDIEKMILDADLKESLREKILSVFKALANVESAVHGIDVAKVEFHEVGSIDTLVDVVGVCAAVDYLNLNKIFCTPPPSGSGFIKTEHGILPVPVPAVLELAKVYSIKLSSEQNQPSGELTTPTGLALIIALADSFSPPPMLAIKSIGIGLGHRSLDRPNLLRTCLLNSLGKRDLSSVEKGFVWEEIFTQEAWIDDATSEDVAMLMSKLRDAGAIDVVSQAIQMKKDRQGISVRALVREKDLEHIRSIWFIHGTTIGLRENREGRWVLPRRMGTCLTSLGQIPIKQVKRPDGRITIKPEYEDLKRISNTTGKPLEEIRKEVLLNLDKFVSDEEWKI